MEVLLIADPAAEFPGVAVACDAVVEIASAKGRREMRAADLFIGSLQTCLASGDVIVAVRFPRWPENRRWAFEEFSRRRGDFALAAIAAWYDLDIDGIVKDTRIGIIGASDIPMRAIAAEATIKVGGWMRLRSPPVPPPPPPPPTQVMIFMAVRNTADLWSRPSCPGRCVEPWLRDAMKISLDVNSVQRDRGCGAAHDPRRLPEARAWSHGNPHRVRTRRLRRLHGDYKRGGCTWMPDSRGAG